MATYREKIKTKDGNVVCEKRWLESWKKKNKETVGEIRKKIKEEKPYTGIKPGYKRKGKQFIESLVDAEILEPVWEGPDRHPDGQENLIYYQDSKNWEERGWLVDKHEIEEEKTDCDEELYAAIDSLPTEQREILQMRFGIGGHKPMTFLEISQKIHRPAMAALRIVKRAIRALRQELQKA